MNRRTEAKFEGMKNGNICVKHREYLFDIPGNPEYTVTRIEGNPGLSGSFPWLCNLSVMFERYKFRKLHLVYETMKSTATNGTVLLGVDYDAQDDSPATKTAFMAFKSSVRSPTWTEVKLILNPADINQFVKERYVRSTAHPSGTDIKTYDFGNMYVGVQGQADSTTIGEIYVEYEVELLTPKLDNSQLASMRSAYFYHDDVGGTDFFSGFTRQTEGGGLDVNIVGSSPTKLVFERVGEYVLNFSTLVNKSGGATFDRSDLDAVLNGTNLETSIPYFKTVMPSGAEYTDCSWTIFVKVLSTGAALWFSTFGSVFTNLVDSHVSISGGSYFLDPDFLTTRFDNRGQSSQKSDKPILLRRDRFSEERKENRSKYK